jgi:hypothetical protein
MSAAWLDDETQVPPEPAGLPRILGRAQATALGLTRSAIDHHLYAGRWRRVLPRTYSTVDTMTWMDRLTAALTFAGADAMLSGAAALSLCRMRCIARPSTVLVLVPATCRRRSVSWVRIRPTNRLPEPLQWYGPRRVDAARAVADHSLELSRLDDVRTVVAEAVSRSLCSLDELRAELDAGPRRGSARLRSALDEVQAGAASAPEARAARILRRAGAPPFEQNARIELPTGGYYVADLLWRGLKAILEIDSREYHFAPADWRATMDRHLALSTLGYSVVHRPPSALRNPQRFADEILAWLQGRPATDCT